LAAALALRAAEPRYAEVAMFASKTSRILAWIAVAVCATGGAAGAFYIWGGGFDPTIEDATLDDDDDDDAPAQEAGPGAQPQRKKKKSGARRSGPRAKAPRPGGASGPSGMSYEAAIARNNRQLAPGTKEVPDLTDVQLAGPMRNVTFLDACGVPSSTRVTVKVAIRAGRAVGVSVYSTPKSDADGCVERRVRNLYWPYSAKMDSFVTTY
jgi:hypothetical protein